MDASAVYSIGAVARMLEVEVSTLRTWEDRFGVVVASRSAGGQRHHTRAQVAQLRFVVTRSEEELRSGDAHQLLAARG